jgi:hypothetical protein
VILGVQIVFDDARVGSWIRAHVGTLVGDRPACLGRVDMAPLSRQVLAPKRSLMLAGRWSQWGDHVPLQRAS